jgi:hypothetical protein
MILSSLNLISKQEMLHQNFQLILYASFQNREEAIALDLLEGL